MSTMQIIRLASGDTIQVRSGVLQGIGPAGPQGQVGPTGAKGDQGDRGETGPIGRMDDFLCECQVTQTTVAALTDTIVGWSSIVDELNLKTSATNFGFITQNGGAYHVSGWVRWSNPVGGATGYRQLQVLASTRSLPLVSIQLPAIYCPNVSFQFHTSFTANPNDTLNVHVYHNDDESLNVEAGRITFYRIGSGPKGDIGIQGVIGPQGPTGPAGPTGLTGSQGPCGTAAPTIDQLGP